MADLILNGTCTKSLDSFLFWQFDHTDQQYYEGEHIQSQDQTINDSINRVNYSSLPIFFLFFPAYPIKGAWAKCFLMRRWNEEECPAICQPFKSACGLKMSISSDGLKSLAYVCCKPAWFLESTMCQTKSSRALNWSPPVDFFIIIFKLNCIQVWNLILTI